MAYDEIVYEVSDWVATITLNRPERLNAWTSRMEEETSAALRAASADDAVRAVVLTGAGRGFCAGADMSLLSDVVASGGAGARRTADIECDGDAPRDFRKKHAWLLTVPKPIIAAINGPAVGLGFVIPLYCDFRFASEAAKFSVIFSKRGLVAEYGMAWMLPRLVGLPNAIELMFTSKTIDAQEALRIGLVNRVIPADGFVAAAQAFARELATSVSPRSLRIMKQQVYAAQLHGLGDAVDLAVREMVDSFGTEDFREGVAHYLEKRAPKFTGR